MKTLRAVGVSAVRDRPPGGPHTRRARLHAAFTTWCWLHWRHLDVKRSVAVITGLAIGTAGALAVLILYDSIAEPYRALDRHVAGVSPDTVAVTSNIGPWLPAEDVHAFDAATGPVPVSGGFTDVGTDGGTRGAGVLVLGADCRVESLVGEFDCAAQAAELGSRAGSDLPGLIVTSRVARALDVRTGDRLVFPWGQEAVVAAVADDGRLAEVNGGYVAFGEVSSVAEIFGHADEVFAIYLTRPPGDVDRVVDATLGGRARVTRLGADTGDLVPALRQMRRFLILGGIVASVLAVFLGASVFVTAAIERRRELATVAMLGQSRWRLAAGFMTEGALLGLAAGGVAVPLGIALGTWLREVFMSSLLAGSGVRFAYTVPLWMALLTIAVSVLLGIAAAGLPVWNVLRESPARTLAHNAVREYGTHVRGVWALAFIGLSAAGIAVMWVTGTGWISPGYMYWGHPVYIVGAIGTTVVLAPQLVRVLPRSRRSRALNLASSFVQADLGLAPWRTGLTVAILSAGVSLLVGLNGLVASLEHVMQAPANEAFDSYVVIGRPIGDPAKRAIGDDVVERLAALPDVEAALPVASLPVGRGATVLALPATQETLRAAVGAKMDSAETAARLRAGQILVSSYAATRLGVRAGDSVTLPTRSGPRRIGVAGVADPVFGTDVSEGIVLVADLDAASTLWGAAPTNVFLEIRPGGDVEAVKATVEAEESLVAYDTGEYRETAARFVRNVMNPLLAIAWMLILIAAAGVLIILLVTLWDRRYQRAALRQLGMSRTQETWALLADGATLTLLAVLFGTIGGLFYEWGSVMTGPVLVSLRPQYRIAWDAVVMAAIVAGTACFVGALLPIMSSRRFDPIHVLRMD